MARPGCAGRGPWPDRAGTRGASGPRLRTRQQEPETAGRARPGYLGTDPDARTCHRRATHSRGQDGSKRDDEGFDAAAETLAVELQRRGSADLARFADETRPADSAHERLSRGSRHVAAQLR